MVCEALFEECQKNRKLFKESTIIILLKCKFEINYLQFLATCCNVEEKKVTSGKHQKLGTNFMYFFELEEFLIMIAILIYCASPISLVHLEKVFKGFTLFDSLAQEMRLGKADPNCIIILVHYVLQTNFKFKTH